MTQAHLRHGSTEAAKLTSLAQTSFQGTTLRGLLLEAYAFGTFGAIALYAGIASFALAGAMLILVLFGFWHSRRVPGNEDLLVHHPGPARQLAV